MTGFDQHYMDPTDYILKCTQEIWEERRISSLYRHYAPDIVVRSPASVVVGNRGVIGATMATLHEFPDRQLPGEDVIWCPAPSGGFLSSHRLICTATHRGDGVYGPASGRRLRYRILADCHAVAGQINDEWLVRDQAAIVAQMGLDPKAWAVELIAREGGPERCVRPFHPARDVVGPYTGVGNDSPIGDLASEMLEAIMAGDLSVIPARWHRAAALAYPGGIEGRGPQDADRFWLALRAAFPSAQFLIHHRIGRQDPSRPYRAALRWSLTGRHDGHGRFGPATGAEVHVMGITHLEFAELGSSGLRVQREWTLIDDTAVWKQIALMTG
ncbi:MAG: ester cyclase [Shimia sp.]